jgi:hypothetical protein
MTVSGLFNKPQYNEVVYNNGTVASIEGKYHIKLGGIGFILTHDPVTGRHNFGRDQAPTFVSKFGAGDPTYRDSSFFPHWVQMNWRNGAKQQEWDDEGRFFKSQNLDVTTELQVKLSRLLVTLSLAAGATIEITSWAIDFSDSRKVLAGCSNGHVYSLSGTTWSDLGDVSAVGGGQAGRRINCLFFSKIGLNGGRAAGAGQIYAGVGTPAGTGGTNAAQLYRWDGAWASAKVFTGFDALTCITEFNSEVYVGLGGTAMIQKASDANLATWTVSKDIDYPGYVWDLEVYNQRLYAACGHPENSPTVHQLGTLYNFDGYVWSEVAPFMGTVLKSLCVYDNLLFIGTTSGQLYVYNRANIDLLYEMPVNNAIYDMVVYNDKLYMAVSYRDTDNSENAVYVFDRAGTHKAHFNAAVIPTSLLVVGDDLYIGNKTGGTAYKIDKTKYNATGEVQSSYFNANLPNIDKVWFDCDVEMVSLPVKSKVEMYYKTDEADTAWVKIDETVEVGKTLAKFALPEGLYSKKLSYRLVISTTDSTTSPTINKVIFRYIIQPDFKYLWRFKVACPDNLEFLDGSQPTSPLKANTLQNDTIITVGDSSGFPDPLLDKMYCVIENEDTGERNEIYYTGKEGNTLTGCGSVVAHDISTGSFRVSVAGRHFHKKILELKHRKAIVEYVDIDAVVYRVLMHDYSEDGFVMNARLNEIAGLENEVSITLLQA